MASKLIFVTGGVLSSIGKGITASSIGTLLESRGFKVTIQKLDPYLNVDAGTMNPYQHGEVYVTDDGAETDLDLGHYERFTKATMKRINNITSGQIYQEIIQKERRGEFLGGTVQVIPHVTNLIKEKIKQLMSTDVDVVIVEVGGTVGDIEGLPFLEAIRQLGAEVGKSNAIYIHVTYVPYVKAAGELKTKPTQHSVKELRAIGIQPDIIVCRAERSIPQSVKRKIALFANLKEHEVITAKDLSTIYEVPLVLQKERIDELIIEKLQLSASQKSNLDDWKNIVQKMKKPSKGTVKIAVVGKYIELPDAYKSIIESFVHAGAANDVKVEIKWVNAEELDEKEPEEFLSDVSGVLVPGGFGERGVEGKIKAIKFARENKIPFFGICLGMQCAVIEFARNVAGLKDAHSSEFSSTTPYPVIDLMEEQKKVKEKGGTMRLGAYPCVLKEGTLSYEAYKENEISERHRHRYEFNNKFREVLEKAGLVIAGTSPDGRLVEIVEINDHPWFVAVQFHPEFKSRPRNPHPLFKSFVKAAKELEEQFGS
ncbi:CTP synthase [Desulfurobacterium thermolithotrophum DSM 11699]|uniref:CTP synthase n=1 Tax=Desulfurobacterium thermolithotrophum (strain DSM 11699 / BSA) TaxID=868864 RepID=F0S3E6_DESTD|nr:CTP synthase [Desulfurobacterium thermolithotrophum]ADY73368.1 CTP synthase [Desulfurobacterium thermolithotrophum DSM 11699]